MLTRLGAALGVLIVGLYIETRVSNKSFTLNLIGKPKA